MVLLIVLRSQAEEMARTSVLSRKKEEKKEKTFKKSPKPTNQNRDRRLKYLARELNKVGNNSYFSCLNAL